MTIKWSKKIAIEHLEQLKNPFAKLNQNGQKPRLAILADKIRQAVTRSREGTA